MKRQLAPLIAATALIVFSANQSHADTVLFDAFTNQVPENTSTDSIPANFIGFWQSGGTEGVSRTIETGNRLILAVDGGGAPETAQTASLRTTDVHSDLNFFTRKLDFTLSDVDLSTTEMGGSLINGVFQFGLAPIPEDSTNTGRPNLIYFRIRPGTSEIALVAIQDELPEELFVGVWDGPLTSLTISLALDDKTFDLSLSSGERTFTTGSMEHRLNPALWDTSMAFGMWTQSFGGSRGDGPGVTTSIDSLRVKTAP